MRRSGFKRPEPPPRREREPGEFASVVIERPRSRMVRANAPRLSSLVPALLQPKLPDRRQQSLRDSARGEDCTVRIPGVCTCDPEKTIWSHAPLGAAGKGMGIKALDLCGAYACTACDAAVDGQVKLPLGLTHRDVLLDWCFGHLRSLVRARQKGLL